MSAQIDSVLCEYWQTPVLFLVGEFDAPSSFIEANERLQELGRQSDIIVYLNEGHLIPPHYLDDDCAIVRWLIDE
jgi:pimeloyl-ACP methyl ester carboxylesterase